MAKLGTYGLDSQTKVDTIGLPEYSVRNRPRLGPTTTPNAPKVATGKKQEACGETTGMPYLTPLYGNRKVGTGGK